MLDRLVIFLTKAVLRLRYKIEVKGRENIADKGKSKILFLPNHPSYIDPVIVYTYLFEKFPLTGLAYQEQLQRPFFGWLAKRWGVKGIPPVRKFGSEARDEISRKLSQGIESLKQGGNFILWPSGTLYRSRDESIGANSSVEQILNQAPDVRVVLIRTRGLWGSRFSWARGSEPFVGKVLKKGFFQLLANLIFFMPKRKVTVEICAPSDFPREADREKINRYLENFYNENAEPNHYVPYYFWQGSKEITMPEPKFTKKKTPSVNIPAETENIVTDYLKELTGKEDISKDDNLAYDLGADSLTRTDTVVWLEKEFGCSQIEPDALQSVEDVMAAACGEHIYKTQITIKPPAKSWFKKKKDYRLFPARGETITEVFLNQARENISDVIVADRISGTRTNRQVIQACISLRDELAAMPGNRLGIMFPASVTADILFLSTLFAGKTPVMINWTTGSANIAESLDELGVNKVITSQKVLKNIRRQGIDLSAIEKKFVYIENLAQNISAMKKNSAFILSYIHPGYLKKYSVNENAAILFTSGSQTKPKAVPLSHKNLLSNLQNVFEMVEINSNDKLIGILPPFHSFGLTGNILVPLCTGAKTVYHTNPLASAAIAEITDKYRPTVLMGTPGFIQGIIRNAEAEQLSWLRLIISGAEKCGGEVFKMIADKCPKTIVLEGYGVTECSPIITINPSDEPRKFSIGKMLSNLDYILLDAETEQVNPDAREGILAVTGDNVFSGYLNFEDEKTFINYKDKKWYNTADILEVDQDGYFYFKDRLKRFVKIAGEMISLGAIEAVLEKEFSGLDKDEPTVAVESVEEYNKPQIVLFTTLDIGRSEANEKIRDAGFSGLYNIRKVVKAGQIPTLATGKKNYKKVKSLIKENDTEK